MHGNVSFSHKHISQRGPTHLPQKAIGLEGIVSQGGFVPVFKSKETYSHL